MKKKKQSGGFGLGLIVGLLSGLALALAVALYVTKVPIPFVNKLPPRASSEREAEESERNKNWDPNAPLHGNRPARPAATATAPATAPATAAATSPAPAAVSTAVRPPDDGRPQTAGSVSDANPAAADAPAPRTMAAPMPSTASRSPTLAPVSPPSGGPSPALADPSAKQATAIFSDRPAPLPGDSALSTKSRDDPFIYYVQAGAYGRQEDAEQQRAKLAMIGMEAKVTEREQAGRTVFRVRVGPFDKRERADDAKTRLAGASMDGVLVRVQK